MFFSCLNQKIKSIKPIILFLRGKTSVIGWKYFFPQFHFFLRGKPNVTIKFLFLKHIEKGNKNRRLKRMSIDLSKVELFPRKHLGGIEVACTYLFNDGSPNGKKYV